MGLTGCDFFLIGRGRGLMLVDLFGSTGSIGG